MKINNRLCKLYNSQSRTSNIISFMYVLTNYNMEKNNHLHPGTIFKILIRVEKLSIYQLGKIRSIEKRNKTFSESTTFLRLFPKIELSRFTYEMTS